MRNIIIIGSSFAAVKLARELSFRFRSSSFYKIYLVSESNYLEFSQARLKFTFCLGIEQKKFKDILAFPIAEILKNSKIRIIHKSIYRLNLANQKIIFSDRSKLDFYKLIFAEKAEIDMQDISGVREYANFYYNLPTAIACRNRIEKLLEHPHDKHMNFVIVGTGFAGVEAAAHLQSTLKDPEFNGRYINCEVILVEKNKRILEGIGSRSSYAISQYLQKLGIKIIENKSAHRVYKYCLEFSNHKILEYDFLLWTAGRKGSDLSAGLRLPKDKQGYLLGEDCAVEEKLGLYGAGESLHESGQRTIQLELSQAEYLVRHIYHEITKDSRMTSFRPETKIILDANHKLFAIQGKTLIRSNFRTKYLNHFITFSNLSKIFSRNKALSIIKKYKNLK